QNRQGREAAEGQERTGGKGGRGTAQVRQRVDTSLGGSTRLVGDDGTEQRRACDVHERPPHAEKDQRDDDPSGVMGLDRTYDERGEEDDDPQPDRESVTVAVGGDTYQRRQRVHPGDVQTDRDT